MANVKLDWDKLEAEIIKEIGAVVKRQLDAARALPEPWPWTPAEGWGGTQMICGKCGKYILTETMDGLWGKLKHYTYHEKECPERDK